MEFSVEYSITKIFDSYSPRIFRSGDICLFVNLATVLNKNLGLFWLLSMSLQICSVPGSF